MSPEEQARRKNAGEFIATQSLKRLESYMEDKFEPALKGANRSTRYVLKAVPKLGSGVYTVGKILGAEDRPRAIAGAVGGWVGGAAGGALGAATGPAAGIAAPVGVVVGSAAGEEFAEDLYDSWREANARRLAETRRINERRNAEQRRNGR